MFKAIESIKIFKTEMLDMKRTVNEVAPPSREIMTNRLVSQREESKIQRIQ